MDLDRIQQEVTAIGLTVTGIHEGEVKLASLPPAKEAAYQAALSLHIEDQTTYLSTNLETHAASLKALITIDEWLAYKDVQKNLRKSLRKAAHEATSNDLFFDWQAAMVEDGLPHDDLKNDWMDERGEIEIEYPEEE